MKKEDFVWSIYTPKNCRAIELRFQNTGRNVSWLLIARQHNNEYINNISKRLEELLAYGKKYAEERCKDDEEKATSEISKFCKEISGDTIMKILWGKEKFDKIYQMVVAQNKLEDDANIAYKELSEILKAEKLDIGLNALVH
ncbi:hypothetical protein HYT92_03530 [Candidatus Pacearchaeota archaeon]|nr:hypothetical protein [Candidatus Pacearchaeota archaeon]